MLVNFFRVVLPLLLALSLLGGRPAAAQQYPPWYPADSALVVRKGDSTIFRLNVDGSFYMRGTEGVDRIPLEGPGLRLMWFAGRGALRAGASLGAQWDESNIGKYSVALGYSVYATGDYAFAVGLNSSARNIASVALGENNTATGRASVALGHAAHTNARSGSFVFGDYSTTVDTIYAGAHNQATWRVAGGFRIFTSPNRMSGVSLAANGSSWDIVSDRSRKYDFQAVDGEELLGRLRAIPVTSWHYVTEGSARRHIGPMAQDWHAALGLSQDSLTINSGDFDGVNLAAIQALEKRTREQHERMVALTEEVARMREENARLRGENEGLRRVASEFDERLARMESLLRKEP